MQSECLFLLSEYMVIGLAFSFSSGSHRLDILASLPWKKKLCFHISRICPAAYELVRLFVILIIVGDFRFIVQQQMRPHRVK